MMIVIVVAALAVGAVLMYAYGVYLLSRVYAK